MTAIDPKSVAANWALRGFSCDLWTDPPGQQWQNFRHESDELVMVLEGDMEFEIHGRTQRPKAGHEILILAGDVHSVRNVGTTTARWLYGYKRSS